MIYWFSGTGNSARVARELAKELHDERQSMTEALLQVAELKQATSIGFVFPVYGWGMPRAVERFVEQLPTWPADLPKAPHTYIYSVLTCGDDIGRTDRLLRDALTAKGWPLDAVHSVQMRNTYVCLPGFDTDAAELVAQKEEALQGRLRTIAECIKEQRPSTPADVTPGALPGLKSYVLRPLFNRFLTSDSHFRVDADRCIHCGRCVEHCPLHNVELTAAGTPQWKGDCTHCLACYHGCPKHAIEYGLFTRGKGQVRINF